ncbi:MAG: hypothetical protein AAF481_11860 [Acidobacteriota bacterium]
MTAPRRILTVLWLPLALGGCAEAVIPAIPEAFLRGHQEIAVQPDGTVLPRAFGRPALSLCFDAREIGGVTDRQGYLTFDGRTAGSTARPPVAVMGNTACFEDPMPSALDAGRTLQVCGQVVDQRTEQRWLLPCQSLLFEGDDDIWQDLHRRLRAIPSAHPGDANAVATDFAASSDEARDLGFPLLALRFRAAAAAAAGDPVLPADSLPDWLDHPIADEVAVDLLLRQAESELDRPGRALPLLADAERRALRIASVQRIAVAAHRTTLLRRAGALGEASHLLGTAVEDCASSPCDAARYQRTQGQLGALLLADPDADDAALRDAERKLARALAGLAAREQPRLAIEWVLGLARLQIRLGRDPEPVLDRARRMLAELEPRDRALEDETDWIEALQALILGRSERALTLCQRIKESADPDLAARAHDCVGRALRAEGDPRAAYSAFADAVAGHEFAAAAGRAPRLGPRQRADDFARAARQAAELGNAAESWDFLERLDRLEENERRAYRCREEPGSVDRCRPVTELAEVDFRAIALPEEVLVLQHLSDGSKVVRRQSPQIRRELVRSADEVDRALAVGSLPDADWIERTLPFAEALSPAAAADLPPVTTWRLHGVLARVPLAGLPVVGGDERWLFERTVPILQRTGNSSFSPDSDRRSGSPELLFVIDPTGDLEDADYRAAHYRRGVPTAIVLGGERATVAAVFGELRRGRALHAVAPLEFEAAAPWLSRLRAAEGTLPFTDLGVSNLPFAYLAEVHQNADRPGGGDTLGAALALAREGVPWVLAKRGTAGAGAGETLVREHADAFYRALAAGRSLPQAHGAALRELSSRHSPVAWAAFELIRGSSG